MNILLTIRNKLINDINITNLVGQNIYLHSTKQNVPTRLIILQETLGNSEIILNATRGIFTIQIYVKDSDGQPYKTLKEITQTVLDVLNRKNETLTDVNTDIRLFVKTSGEPIHNDEEQYWMLPIVFDYVAGEL